MKIIRLLYIMSLAALLGACSEDSLDPVSIFPTTSTTETLEFDKWLKANYVDPYNVEVQYRYDDKETDNEYNLVPATYEQSVALALMIKHVWIDSYAELMGEGFVKQYTPRKFLFVGSKAYNPNVGSEVLGTAEGGTMITLYNVNGIDIQKPDLPALNEYFFKTIHHEFGHILQQKKVYPKEFDLISAADYQPTDWINTSDENAAKKGFVSPYASSEAIEDFVEVLSIYVTNTQAYWDSILKQAGDTGTPIIQAKFDIVKNYLQDSWQIDIEKLREIVLRRSDEILEMDLTSLN